MCDNGHYREEPSEVEKFRAIAATTADRACYYRAALRFQLARAQGSAKMVAAIREAAALDGVELEEGNDGI